MVQWWVFVSVVMHLRETQQLLNYQLLYYGNPTRGGVLLTN